MSKNIIEHELKAVICEEIPQSESKHYRVIILNIVTRQIAYFGFSLTILAKITFLSPINVEVIL